MLSTGLLAPEFDLEAIDGKRYSLAHQLTVLAFFKTNCPTCQYAWPFYDRLHRSYQEAGLQVLGISQHDRPKTMQFASSYGSTFPLLLDTGLNVSWEYGLEFVPTVYLIDTDKNVLASYVSWSREQFDELSGRISEQLKTTLKVLIGPGENVAPFRPG